MKEIVCGDSLVELKKLEENSVDVIVTDPPFGIGFMGKAWDTFKPDYVEKSREVASKSFHKNKDKKQDNPNIRGRKNSPVASPAEQAGTYKHTPDANRAFQQFIYEISVECLRVLKPGGFMFMCMTPRQDSLARAYVGIEDAGFKTGFTSMYWTYATGFPKANNIGKSIDKKLGREREVVGKTNAPDFHDVGQAAKQLHGIDKMAGGNMGSNYKRIDAEITKGTSEFEGSYGGFQPKPAVEVIIVAQKPGTEKTQAGQALMNGKGITWLDDCRIPYADDGDRFLLSKAGNSGSGLYNWNVGDKKPSGVKYPCHKQGRFPANLLISDDVLDDGRITKSSDPHRFKKNLRRNDSTAGEIFGKGLGGPQNKLAPCDSGTFSRFFSLDAWARSNLPFLIVPKASKKEKNAGLDGMEDKQATFMKGSDTAFRMSDSCHPVKNNHPTIKPIKLMSYLITMGSRPGDVVLDPFMGSGTTCIAAHILDRDFIGVELDPDYVQIAEARLNALL